MRVLYFYQYFGTPQGSWSTRVYEFARRWVRRGDQVTVITSVYDKSDLRPSRRLARYDIDGIEVRVINIRLSNHHGWLGRLVSYAAFAIASCWYALTLPADVVVASSGPISVGLPGLVARWLRRTPLVFEVRDLWPEGAIQLGMLRNRLAITAARWFERICYSSAARVIALSEGQAEWIRDRYGMQHVAVVPNASDNELMASLTGPWEPPAWASDKKLAVYAGSLGLMDDCGQILKMAQVLQQRGVEDVAVVLIGDGRFREALQREAAAMRLANVHFLGLLPKKEALRWLQAARCALVVFKDVPVMGTVSPNKLFDAFAAGVPVVQTTQGWIRRLLEKEGCGLTAAADDPQGMADGVLQLCNDADLRQRMSCRARRVALEQFDRSKLADEMYQQLQAVARRPQVTAPAAAPESSAGCVGVGGAATANGSHALNEPVPTTSSR